MAINIDVRIAKTIPTIKRESLTLVIFKNARQLATPGGSPVMTPAPVNINTLKELYDNFGGATAEPTILEARELYCAEYLLRAGVNLLCYSLAVAGTLDAATITAIEDYEVLEYKFIVVPYSFLTDANLDGLLIEHAKDSPVQLFLDLLPFAAPSTVAAIQAAVGTDISSKLEVYANFGLPLFKSNYTIVPSDFDLAVAGAYAAGTDFVGIPSSLASLARKATVVNARKPWIPIAGETNGSVPEFTKLLRKIKTVEKEDFQKAGVNVLVMKTGVGNLFVSQNTQEPFDPDDDEEKRNPLIRSHVVTTTLWIKRNLDIIAQSILYAPNSLKTWNEFTLATTSLLDYLLESGGIEEGFTVRAGRGITMSDEDIDNGIFRASISFLPIRVVEEINIDLIIQSSEDSYDITINGGVL